MNLEKEAMTIYMRQYWSENPDKYALHVLKCRYNHRLKRIKSKLCLECIKKVEELKIRK